MPVITTRICDRCQTEIPKLPNDPKAEYYDFTFSARPSLSYLSSTHQVHSGVLCLPCVKMLKLDRYVPVDEQPTLETLFKEFINKVLDERDS